MERSGVIAGGNWLIDHVKVIDAWPEQDSLATILEQSWGNGGGPYNVLKNLAKLGAEFPLEGVGLVGEDGSGERIREDCRAHGVDVRQLRTTREAPTSFTDVMTDVRTRRRTFFHQRGANALLAPEHFDFSATRAKWFHLGYLLLLDRLDELDAEGRPRALEVFRRARAGGLKTSLDCVSDPGGRFQSVVAPVLPEVDVLFANDFEVEKLTGLTLGRGETLRREAVVEAGRLLLRRGVREWVVVHCPEGACACGVNGETIWQPSVRMPAAEIAGTAGAGDALAAGVLMVLHDGGAMEAGLKLGVCAAAASLRHATCSEALEMAAACLGLGARFGFYEAFRENL